MDLILLPQHYWMQNYPFSKVNISEYHLLDFHLLSRKTNVILKGQTYSEPPNAQGVFLILIQNIPEVSPGF